MFGCPLVDLSAVSADLRWVDTPRGGSLTEGHVPISQIGIHGLIINFYDPETRVARNATFLPEVADHEVQSRSVIALFI